MARLLLILLIGLVFESTGVVLLKTGMTRIGEVKAINAAEIARVVKAGLTSPMSAINAPLAIHFISLLPSVD